jgi:hypothetical protein
MRNRGFMALGVAVLVSVLAFDVEARPGGGRRGGARPGGGRIGNIGGAGNVRAGQIGQNIGGKLQSLSGNVAGNLKNGNLQNKASQLKTNFAANNQPFSASWYANHPNAWRYTHPHADAWAIATLGTAAAWLGIAATSDAYPAVTENVYTSDEADNEQSTDEPANENPQQQNADQQNAGDFLPLGVFAIAPRSEKDASALVQLAVDKQGQLRGNYYDVLTGRDQPISGTLDKKTQRATFQAGGGDVTFETTLANLTARSGSVTLRFQNGQTRQWTLARFEDRTAAAN